MTTCQNCGHDESDHHRTGRWEVHWICFGGHGSALKPTCMCNELKVEVEAESEEV